MIAKTKTILRPVASKIDEELLKRCEKKMQKDRKNNKRITWRDIWETGIKYYLKEE